MNKLLAIFSFLLIASFYSVGALAVSTVEDAYEAPKGRLFDEAAYLRGETLLNQYTNVVVVNKAAKGPEAQKLRLYTNRQLMLTTDVSTGRENVENISAIRGFLNGFSKGSTKSHWRHTTRGFYTIKRVHGYSYRSGESNFMMPYAMFFNEQRGLALHQVPPDLGGGEAAGNAALGTRASGGCVRVHKNHIQIIHQAVTAADKGQVPVLDTKTGRAVRDDKGNVRYSSTWKTIVIVEEY